MTNTTAKQRISKKPQIVKDSSPSKNVAKPLVDYWGLILRILMIGGILVLVYLSKKDQLVTFASYKEELSLKSADVECSQDYIREVNQFPGCVPKRCSRMVLDSVVTPMEVLAMKSIAERGLMHGGSSGGASILDLHSGALSRGNSFVNIYNLGDNLKIFNEQDFTIYSLVKNKIKKVIVEHFQLDDNKVYLTHPTFFSRISDEPAQTVHDEYWHPHVDKDTYESFHYTSLLYLNDYKQDFDGGRFVFIDKDSNKTVEPRSGRLSIFTSGSENLHQVERLKGGIRYAITVSFTCDPKHAIQDPKLPVR